MSLFNPNLYPITSAIAFINESPEIIVAELIKWQTPLIEKYRNTLSSAKINKDFTNTLLSLCPLTTAEIRKYLLIPINSEWTAFFDNGHTGTDSTAPKVLGRKLNKRMIYISNSKSLEENTFSYYDVKNNEYELIRSIAVIKESKWEFHQYGKIFDFENTDNFKSRIIKNRFTNEMVIEYLNHFGINLDKFNFCNSIIVSKIGPKFEQTKELSLEEAQIFFR